MCDSYYVVTIGAFLHDIGKIVTNYLYDHKDFMVYIEKGRGVKSHRHAKVGSLLLSNYGFPEYIVHIVEKHHESDVKDPVKKVQWADRFDASYRAGTARDKGRKLPIEIGAAIGLDVTKTLHGFDLGNYVKHFLEHINDIIVSNPKLAALLIDGFYREATIHLRSDSIGDDNISLYAHSKIVAALTSLKVQYPDSNHVLVVIEPAIEERAQFMTVDVIEYLAGLHLYTYFGVLGAASCMLNDLRLDPSFHIASEMSSRFVVIIGEEHVGLLVDRLRRLATDLAMPIHVESYIMRRGILRKDANIRIEPEPLPLSATSQLVCDICHQPIYNKNLMLILKRASKTLRLCERCSIIMHTYKVLANSKGILCIKRGEDGLLKYPRLSLAVTLCDPFEDSDYIVARIAGFQAKSIEDKTALIPSIDIYLNVFRKEYKYFTGISYKRLLNKLINEGKLHEYISTVNILNRQLMHIIGEASQNTRIYPLEILDDRAILEILSPFDLNSIISNSIKSELGKYTIITILRRGAPGTAYKRLRYMIQEIANTDKILAIEAPENALSLKDVSVFKELAQLLNIPYNTLYKRLIKLMEVLDEYINSFKKEDEIEKVYLKSIILSRLFEPSSRDEKEGLEVFGLLPFLEAESYEELVVEKEEVREKISKFFEDEGNVRSIINTVSFLNRIGEVILLE